MADAAQGAASAAQAAADAKADPMTATAHGSEIVVSDSADAAIGGLVLYGRSEQGAQTTGKNLLPYEVSTPVTPNGVSINILPDGGLKIAGTTTALTSYSFHAVTSKLNIPAGTYRFLLTGSGTGFDSGNILLQLYTNTGSGLTSRFTSTDRTYTIGSDVVADYVRLRIASDVKCDCVVYPMLILSTETDTTFEKYTGAMPTPNPRFLSLIRSAGMTTGKNLLVFKRGEITGNGVNFSPQPDGSLRIWGTASATTQYNAYTDYTILNLPHGMYRFYLTGSGTNVGDVKMQLYVDNNDGNGLLVASGWQNTDCIYTVRDSAIADAVRIRVAAGTYDCVVYPMVLPVYADDTSFEGYTNGPVGTQVTLRTTGKNLLIPPDLTTPYTHAGITYSYDPTDGAIVLNGTASSTSNLHLGAVNGPSSSNTQHIPNGSYVLSGGVSNSVYLTLFDGFNTTGTRYDDKGNTATMQIALGAIANPRIVVLSGTVCNNLRVYPMFRHSEIEDDTWEPYKAAVAALPTPSGLPGIKVSSGGNYTDENDQQWICDTIDLAAGTYTKRVGQYTFDGSEDWSSSTDMADTSKRRHYYSGLMSVVKCPASNTEVAPVMCDMYPARSITGTGSIYGANQGIGIAATGRVNVYDERYSYAASLSDFKAMLAARPIHCLFALATPVTTPLTEAQLTALRSIRTRDGVTVLTNDADADMDLVYATQTGGGNYVEGVRQVLDDGIEKAQDAADSAQATADAARADFQRVVRIDTEGLHVGDNQTSNEVMIDSESVNVVLGGRKYSKFAGDYVQFGDYQLRRSVDGGLVFKKA